jgi:hypothetical protein
MSTYDEKVTRFRKLLQRKGHFSRNVTDFAGQLSKPDRHLMLMRASGERSAIADILFLLIREESRIDFSHPHTRDCSQG